MSTLRTSLRGLSPQLKDELRTFVAFGILGFGTATIAPTVYAAAYLIIPFPRAAVVIIETLPALAAKLLVPHILVFVPRWLRTLVVAFGLLAASVAIDNIPPNVHPPVRILLTLLAAAATAASEVSFLALLRDYGRVGLAGWGAGTGAGGIAVAVMPYVLTYRWGLFLRSSVGYIYYLLAAMVLAYFLLLPKALDSRLPRYGDRSKADDDEDENNDSSLLLEDPLRDPTLPFSERVRQNLKLASSLIGPYMVPLAVGRGMQALVFPGITRALGISSSFEAYASYYAAYGLCFHLGNLVGRTSVLVVQYPKTKGLLVRLGLLTVIGVATASLHFLAIPAVVFVVALSAGLVGGAVYSNVFAAALVEIGSASGLDREFSLGVIGAGETVGLLTGVVLGSFLEAGLCGWGLGHGRRWCHVVK
ncbi:hypothetical protein S7711_08598 [Stachybotrys chartarum IBT 7711]|uniref:Protein BTN n=1 Tax=Stachybotrys chartarum (strain CBS 109288 / IBT 7711) TaxID=1280523 RepID=A0A084AWY5_STACB|nr:hypothetical protein S7711_08598 [Stachybotrys chartarum IBT 7711]KFA51192.1 hypothetical protein S40293_05080 [Stachybotrys chartarum IBT 40293]KFA75911.1 hypothetical protein S40288_05851 [Stachybotrys chartarum IBT 40288]